jgi:hypothetical protein
MKWYRVFCASERVPALADIEACLAGAGVSASHSPAEEADWVWLRFQAGEATVEVNRFRADEEGIRAELNSWAAFLETCEHDPRHRELMERMIQSKQLFNIEEPSESAREVCVQLSQCLARLADGFYQIDDEGFFEADGAILIADSA